jgi:hypothetical protein
MPVDALCPLPPADRGNFAAIDVLRSAALHVQQGPAAGAPPHAKVTLATTADKLADTGKVGGGKERWCFGAAAAAGLPHTKAALATTAGELANAGEAGAHLGQRVGRRW